MQIKTKIASVLKSEGSKLLLEKAVEIESNEGDLASLHLRNIELNDTTLLLIDSVKSLGD